MSKEKERIINKATTTNIEQTTADAVVHHNDHENHHHHNSDFHDYLDAVINYRKTFPNKKKVIEQTPDPAVREMLLHMQDMGLETVFDRFDKQQPQCPFGIAGICCKNCYMGPCKITAKSPRGVCGADADLIVARNMLRAVAAGTAAHGARGRASMLALKKAGEGTLDLPIDGEDKIHAVCKNYGINTKGKTIKQLAVTIANILLDDLSRTVPATHKTLAAFAPDERKRVWKALDILPISVYHEVFESLHRTSTGTDGDWRNVMHQFLRTGIAFAWTSCLGSSIAMDCLFGLPHRSKGMMNLGALKKGCVNIAIHGHSPLLVSEIVRIGRTTEYQAKAKSVGAKGIQFYGICCSGLSAMYRYGGVIPLSNAIGAELVLGTGALDLWVADVQDVFPFIMNVAKCFKTTVVTTSDSARLPDAEHYGFDHTHSNINEIHSIAKKIVERGIESFQNRRDVPVFIPQYEIESEFGFSAEFLNQHYCVAEPFGAKAVDAGIGHVFTTSQDLWPDSICCGIVFNKEAIKDKKEAVRDFDRIFYSAGDTMTTEEAMFLAKKYLNQNENISRLSLQWISFTNLSITPKAYQDLTNKVREFGLSQNPPSYTDFVKNES